MKGLQDACQRKGFEFNSAAGGEVSKTWSPANDMRAAIHVEHGARDVRAGWLIGVLTEVSDGAAGSGQRYFSSI